MFQLLSSGCKLVLIGRKLFSGLSWLTYKTVWILEKTGGVCIYSTKCQRRNAKGTEKLYADKENIK